MGVHQKVTQVKVVSQAKINPHQTVEEIAFFTSTGAPGNVGAQGAAVASPAALTQAAITGGEPPTEAEFNALRADHANTRTALTNLLASLRTAGVIAT